MPAEDQVARHHGNSKFVLEAVRDAKQPEACTRDENGFQAPRGAGDLSHSGSHRSFGDTGHRVVALLQEGAASYHLQPLTREVVDDPSRYLSVVGSYHPNPGCPQGPKGRNCRGNGVGIWDLRMGPSNGGVHPGLTDQRGCRGTAIPNDVKPKSSG